MQKLPLFIFTAALSFAAANPAHANDDDYCREYTQTITIGGETQSGYGTACLQEDGSWEIVKPASAPIVKNGSNTTITTVSSTPVVEQNIVYVVERDRVFIRPPRPFVVYESHSHGKHYHKHRRGRDFHRSLH